MKSVYSAVRTGPLNEAACAPSFKGYKKNKPQNCPYLNIGRHLYINLIKLLLCIPIFTLERFYGISLILNVARSDDGLNRRLELVTVVNY
jgi:hypothetical protein